MDESFILLLKEFFKKNLSEDVNKRIEKIAAQEKNEFGVDEFGFDPETIKLIAPILVWLYKNYFRVEVFGKENIPDSKCMVIANHSGQLPFDAAMVEVAFLLEGKSPRLLRGMVEKWVSEIPFIAPLFAKAGQVVGTPSTCKHLLDKGEAVIVFPEGVRGISKLFSERYKLQSFGSGFMRIALAAKSPILPIAIIGAEEQAPSVANFDTIAKNLGIPALPLIFPQLIPLPLPVKYRIHIGPLMEFQGDGTEDDQEIKEMVEKVHKKVQSLINHGLNQRENIFF